MKKVFIAATRQNDGKTITSLGMIRAFQKLVPRVGYIKPVGQRYKEIGGIKIDEDALLVREACHLEQTLSSMSPIAIPRGFTEDYILHGDHLKLVEQVKDAFQKVSDQSDLVVVEGTGHAGVGSVFDLNNADVAKLLGCKVILVSAGGIGKPIDEIMLNKAMFDQVGVEVLGVIINRIQVEKYEKINEIVRKGLTRKGVETLGVMPYIPVLSSPSMEQLFHDIGGELLSGKRGLTNLVNSIVVGAMSPHEALDYFKPGVLLITPGSREDLILTAMSASVTKAGSDISVSGMILTGGVRPNEHILDLMKRTRIPVILVKEDTYATASRVDHLIVKVRATDAEKIDSTEELISKYVDIDKIFNQI